MTYISFSSACSKRSNIGRNDSNCRLIHSTLAALRGRTSQEKGLGVRRTPCMRSSMQISSGVSNKRWRDLLHSCHSYQWVLGDQYLDPWEGRNQMPKGGSSRSEPIRVWSGRCWWDTIADDIQQSFLLGVFQGIVARNGDMNIVGISNRSDDRE